MPLTVLITARVSVDQIDDAAFTGDVSLWVANQVLVWPLRTHLTYQERTAELVCPDKLSPNERGDHDGPNP